MLIHIGYHKCGSTWLQQNLFSRLDRGFHPVAPPGTSSAKRLYPYLVRRRDGAILSPFEHRTEEIHAAVRGWECACEGVPVVSAERLSGHPQGGGIDSVYIAQRIKRAFPDAKILIVIREQLSLIIANYFQYLRKGGHRHFQHYFGTAYDGRRPGFTPSYFEFHHLIALYQDLFGKENVLCLPVELLQTDGQTFVDRLRALTGAEIPSDLPFGDKVNEGRPRYVELQTRWLNLAQHSNSLNGYALDLNLKKPVDGLRRHLNRFVSEDRNKQAVQEIWTFVEGKFAGRFADSNRETEELTGLPLKQSFGYQ